MGVAYVYAAVYPSVVLDIHTQHSLGSISSSSALLPDPLPQCIVLNRESELAGVSDSLSATELTSCVFHYGLEHWNNLSLFIITSVYFSCIGCKGSIVPAYSQLQYKFWNVSFLQQWFNWRIQWPNLMLGLPILCLSAYTVYDASQMIVTNNNNKKNVRVAKAYRGRIGKSSLSEMVQKYFYNSLDMMTYIIARPEIIHLALHVIIGSAFAHVQVATRLITSACPLVYTTIAQLVIHATRHRHEEGHFDRKGYTKLMSTLVMSYVCIYVVLGIILQPNFYPWT